MEHIDKTSHKLLKYIAKHPNTPLSVINSLTNNPEGSHTNPYLTLLYEEGYVYTTEYDADPKVSITPKGKTYLREQRKKAVITIITALAGIATIVEVIIY